MRIKLFFGPSQEEIKTPLSDDIVKFLHVCLGHNNKYHDGKSPYSISQMRGGVLGENGYFQYPNGGYFIVSSQDEDFLTDFFHGLYESAKDYQLKTMKFIGYYTYQIQVGKIYDNIRVESMRLKVKNKEITFKDENFIPELINQCLRKLRAIGFNDEDFKTFKIEPFHEENWVVKVCKNKNYLPKPVTTPASRIMLTVKGKREVREKLYYLGIGNSTGAGFGFVKLKLDNDLNQNIIIKF